MQQQVQYQEKETVKKMSRTRDLEKQEHSDISSQEENNYDSINGIFNLAGDMDGNDNDLSLSEYNKENLRLIKTSDELIELMQYHIKKIRDKKIDSIGSQSFAYPTVGANQFLGSITLNSSHTPNSRRSSFSPLLNISQTGAVNLSVSQETSANSNTTSSLTHNSRRSSFSSLLNISQPGAVNLYIHQESSVSSNAN